MKKVSIYGDSISTYTGYNPDGYAVYYDNDMQLTNGLFRVEDTWWARVNEKLDFDLCMNAAYSGSKVTGMVFPSATSEERLGKLRKEAMEPEIILVYLGFNDFGFGVHAVPDFAEAYEHMVVRLKVLYPDAKIVCGTLMRAFLMNREKWVFPEIYNGMVFEDYNEVIRKVCRKENVYLADLSKTEIRYESLDGTHPTVNGHESIAKAWIKCLENYGTTFRG